MNVLRGALLSSLLFLNTVLWGTIILILGLIKFVVGRGPRRRLRVITAEVADRWVGVNDFLFDSFLPTQWDIQGVDGLNRDGRYLIFSNHISWTDIFVVFRTFHRRVSFIRFFLKQELIWFPVVGQACWALDFPFMKRYSAEYLAHHPEKRGSDLKTTRRACRRFRRIPFAILNFLEGTRFTRDKHEELESPYRLLLPPRIGGIGFVLASLGEQLDGVIDVTIAYPDHDVSVWDFVSGKLPRIVVRARQLSVPSEFCDEAIVERGPQRDAFRKWIETIWAEKDELLAKLASEKAPAR